MHTVLTRMSTTLEPLALMAIGPVRQPGPAKGCCGIHSAEPFFRLVPLDLGPTETECI